MEWAKAKISQFFYVYDIEDMQASLFIVLMKFTHPIQTCHHYQCILLATS